MQDNVERTSMNRILFLGDSHTCGYKSFKDMSFTMWNENNYASIYSDLNNIPILIYAQPGSTFRVYTDRLYTMFSRYNDIKEVYLCLTPFNRFTLALDDWSDPRCIPVDFFTYDIDNKEDKIQRFQDETVKENRLQLFQKTLYSDYDHIPNLIFSEEDGLKSPDIRKMPFMPIKTFFEFNTYLEKRDFFNSLYSWDNICNDHNANLYIFNFMDRMIFPQYNDYYGKLKKTTISSKTVESFFKEKGIDHSQYLIEDKEHYNESYHTLIAETFLPWLKNQKRY
jgi:hypothetical protein